MTARIGIQIGATTPAVLLPEIAAEAETLGYGEIWLAEDYFEHGGIASAAAVLSATEHFPVGLGVVAAPARHPAVTAMEFATLAALYPGRFMAGLGHGAPGWVRQMGLAPESPMTLLREVTEAVNRLLDGEELTETGGTFSYDRIRLTHPPDRHLHLYFGVQGPASLRLSGELADGTLLGWFTTAGAVEWARARIEEGRSRVDRADTHHPVVLCVLSISDDDPAAARDTAGRFGGSMLAAMAGSKPMLASEAGRELTALVDTEGKDALRDGPPDHLLGAFAAAGTTTQCAETVQGLLDAGAERVVLGPNPAGMRTTATMVEQIRLGARLIEAF